MINNYSKYLKNHKTTMKLNQINSISFKQLVITIHIISLPGTFCSNSWVVFPIIRTPSISGTRCIGE